MGVYYVQTPLTKGMFDHAFNCSKPIFNSINIAFKSF